mgnify:CR=1 FL=1
MNLLRKNTMHLIISTSLNPNSLMLDYRCRIIPRYVYATGDAFDSSQVANEEVISRIEELVDSIISWSSS